MTDPARAGLPEGCPGAYVFRVTVRLEPAIDGVWADPGTVETTVYRAVDPPEESGWLYFRDNLWRGECSDPGYMRAVAEEALEARVDTIAFREFRTTSDHLDALRAGIESNLDLFNADSVEAVLSNYLGSSVHVVDAE